MVASSPIFRKLFLSALALIAVTLALVDFYVSRYVAGQHVRAVEARLAAQARLLRAEAAGVEAARLEAWARQAAQNAQARITIIDPRGVVLADSEHGPESMENHAGRTEIRKAYGGGMGFAIRRSATLGRDLCYLAMPLADPARPGWVIRLAIPLRDVDAAIAAIRWRVFGASGAAALIALAMAGFFSRNFTRRVRRLQAFAVRLPDSAGSGKLAADANDELGMLASSLTQAAARLRDLFDQVSTESARRETILASMAEGVLALDGGMRVSFCNDAFARAAGARPPVPEGLSAVELVRDPRLLELLKRSLASRERLRDRLQLHGARSFEVHVTPLGKDGALAILHDITELERLERVRKDFVANVSHELRTPLTAIRGYAETLLDGALEDAENRRRFVETIRAHAVRLNNIASDLLALSELESAQAPAENETISVRGAVEAALRAVEPEARACGVTLRRGRMDAVDAAGSGLRLEQALVNLLANAVKFNRPGGEVRVDVLRAADGGAHIAVADTGIGIPSEDLPRIFERFYRVDKARSREVGGTGLGLSIVKHVIERMRGTLQVESRLGEGSVFTVMLPPA
ncbi:MAG: ATP-binding protein [Bryobacteraceae bacterium]